jgi:glutamine amidotransferase
MGVVSVVDYGVGNLFSMTNALRRTGLEAEVVKDPAKIEAADAIILPGVGNFGAAAAKLDAFMEAITRGHENGAPILGSCLGMQLLFEGSDESPGKGLGLLAGRVRRFGGGLKVPHMGWNTIRALRDDPLLEGLPDCAYFYFVHSFYPCPEEAGATLAVTDYGGEFTSIVGQGRVYGTQFHPEKSGKAGATLLSNFAKTIRR